MLKLLFFAAVRVGELVKIKVSDVAAISFTGASEK